MSFKTGKILPYGWNMEHDGVEFELMQYTGLKDKSGKKAYEGDILQDKNGKKYEIIWSKNFTGFLAITKEEHGNCYDVQGLINHGALVLGNIYENVKYQEGE